MALPKSDTKTTSDNLSKTVRLDPELNETLNDYAASVNASPSAAIRIILNTFLRNPRYSADKAAVKSSIREGLLVGYAQGRRMLEQYMSEATAKIEVLERQVYRDKYKDGSLNKFDRETATVQRMDEEGAFDEIDTDRKRQQAQEKRRSEAPVRKLTPSERDAEALTGEAQSASEIAEESAHIPDDDPLKNM